MCFTSHPLYPIDVATGINILCQSVLSVGHDTHADSADAHRCCNGINNLLNLRHPRDMISHADSSDSRRCCNGDNILCQSVLSVGHKEWCGNQRVKK